MSHVPVGITILSEDEFRLRMARGIYLMSKRRDVSIMRGWETLSETTKAVFLDIACEAIRRLDAERAKAAAS